MKIYEGERTLAGAAVTVDGARLPMRRDLHDFSPYFEWTYEGDGPLQLALALLADHLRNDAQALHLAPGFMRDVVAVLDNCWRLTAADIAASVAKLQDSATAARKRA